MATTPTTKPQTVAPPPPPPGGPTGLATNLPKADDPAHAFVQDMVLPPPNKWTIPPAVTEPVTTIADEQRKRSDFIAGKGMQAWIDMIDDRKDAAKATPPAGTQVPGVSPATK